MLLRFLLWSSMMTFLSAQSPAVRNQAAPAKTLKDFPFDIELKDKDGLVIHSSRLFKKSHGPTVLLFWLTTCGPCRSELKAVSEKFVSWQKQKKFSLYAISTDFPAREEQFVARVNESRWPFPAYHDFKRAFSGVMPGGLNGLPQVFVIDKHGKIVYHHRKFIPGDEDLLFEAIMKL